jgi:hypothetical protein
VDAASPLRDRLKTLELHLHLKKLNLSSATHEGGLKKLQQHLFYSHMKHIFLHAEAVNQPGMIQIRSIVTDVISLLSKILVLCTC